MGHQALKAAVEDFRTKTAEVEKILEEEGITPVIARPGKVVLSTKEHQERAKEVLKKKLGREIAVEVR